LLKQKVAQKVAIILGYFIFSKNHNEPPKVAQLAKNCPIWSPWMEGIKNEVKEEGSTSCGRPTSILGATTIN
jgi:hypothetical protein